MIINLRVSPINVLEPEYLERLIANGIAFGVENFPSLSEEIVKTKVNWEAFNCDLARKVASVYLSEPKKREEMLCFSYFLNVSGEFEVINLYETGYGTMDDKAMKIPTLWDYFSTQIQSVTDHGIEANPVLASLSPKLKDMIVETTQYFSQYQAQPLRAGMFGDERQVVFMTGYNHEALYAGVLKKISEKYVNESPKETQEGREEN